MNKSILLLCVLALGGCGSQGTLNSALLKKPVSTNESRLIVTRDRSMLYFAGAADVALDGKPIASLARGASVVEDVEPGKHFITVRAPATIGDYTTSFETKAGKTYNFVVEPNRGKSLVSGAILGQIGEAIDNSGYFQVLPAPAVQ